MIEFLVTAFFVTQPVQPATATSSAGSRPPGAVAAAPRSGDTEITSKRMTVLRDQSTLSFKDDVRAKLISQGVDPGSSTPAEDRALMEAEVKMWAKLVKDAKITLQ